jgi:hypothetical protein
METMRVVFDLAGWPGNAVLPDFFGGTIKDYEPLTDLPKLCIIAGYQLWVPDVVIGKDLLQVISNKSTL